MFGPSLKDPAERHKYLAELNQIEINVMFIVPFIVIYINNCPARCNAKQSIYYSASSLYMFRVSTIPIIRNTQNCNYSLRYWSYFLCSYLPPTWPSLAMLEGVSRTVPEAVVTVLCTPDEGCG